MISERQKALRNLVPSTELGAGLISRHCSFMIGVVVARETGAGACQIWKSDRFPPQAEWSGQWSGWMRSGMLDDDPRMRGASPPVHAPMDPTW